MYSKLLSATIAAVGIVTSSTAFAWGSDGHQAVGAIADLLLTQPEGASAQMQVLAILGTSQGQQVHLQQAAVWADCVRNVSPGFNYVIATKGHEKACTFFEDDPGKQAMVDYAKRNDVIDNCFYEGKQHQCHKTYHFADVPIAFGAFRDGDVGAPNTNIVDIIAACIAMLTDKPNPGPVVFADDPAIAKKEALALLAHFIGDLHQPLHVGAIYLDANGNPITPTLATLDPATGTTGGNFLGTKSTELHGQWDKFTSIDKVDISALAGEAGNVTSNTDDYHAWPAAWASESVIAANSAFKGITFGTKDSVAPGYWPMTFTNRAAYLKNMNQIKHTQIVNGGVRLARLLEAIWPNQ